MKRFAEDAINQPATKRRLHFGPVSNAAQIKAATGKDVDSWRRKLTADEVRKNIRRHGNDREPLRTSDFKWLRSILTKPDAVKRGGASHGRGLQTLISEKRIGKLTYRVVEELQPRRRGLVLLSFSKGK